jgi:hypothetical protein
MSKKDIGYAEDVFSVSEKLIAKIDSSSWIPETLKVSPDSRRMAYGSIVDNKQFVVVDGNEWKQYDGIVKGSNLVFDSPNNLHYLAGEGNKIYLVEMAIKSGSSK